MCDNWRQRKEWCAGYAALLIMALAGVPDIIGAQGSGTGGCSVTEQVDCTMLHRNDGRERQERRWPTAIVLWRMPPHSVAFRTGSTEAKHDFTSVRYRELQRAAEDSGWRFMGGRSGPVIQELAIDSANRRIRIRDRIFAVPERDSALVVMVDLTRDSAYTPLVVGYTYVPAELPEGYWTKHWTSGDTTFFVRPRNNDVMLSRLLRANPSIAAFLNGH